MPHRDELLGPAGRQRHGRERGQIFNSSIEMHRGMRVQPALHLAAVKTARQRRYRFIGPSGCVAPALPIIRVRFRAWLLRNLLYRILGTDSATRR